MNEDIYTDADSQKNKHDWLNCVHAIIKEGDMQKLEEFLESSKDTTVYNDARAELPLYIAVDNQEDTLVDILLKHGADIANSGNCFKTTSLMLAVTKDKGLISKEIIRSIIKYSTMEGINAQDYSGNTALFMAIGGQDLEVIRWLLEAGADPLLTRAVDAPDPTDYYGYSTLMHAMDNDEYEVFKMLLYTGRVDLNMADSEETGTYLEFVIMKNCERMCGDWDVAKQEMYLTDLLHAGADPNFPGREGGTAMHYAAQLANQPSFATMLQHGGNMERVDDLGHTPFLVAINNRHYAFATWLITLNCNVKIQLDLVKGLPVNAYYYIQSVHRKPDADMEHFVRMLTEAGLDGREKLARWRDEHRWTMLSDDFKKWVLQYIVTPSSLMCLTRICIRNSLIQPFDQSVPTLSIPNALKTFIR